jgi:hypothetical protein
MSEQLPLGTPSPDEFEMTRPPTAAADVDAASSNEPSMQGVLTNRWNLIEFLSRRLIVPEAAFTKCYDDLLKLTPGRIPLVDAPVSAQLIDAVTGEDSQVIFPVFIEVNGHDRNANPAAIRWSDTFAVHFRSERDLREHSAREFANVPTGINALVSPDLFGPGAQYLESISQPSTAPDPDTSGSLDRSTRWAAALLLGTAAIANHADAGTAAAVGRLLDDKKWGKADCPHLQPIRSMRLGKEIRSGRNLEQKLFAAIARRLCSEGHPGDPVEFVLSLKDELELDDKSSRAIDKIAAIVDGEEEFHPFRGGGSTVAKALLVVLLRREPKNLMPWAAEHAKADPATLLTAGIFMGLARGRHVLPVASRPDTLDKALVEIEFAAATSQTWSEDVSISAQSTGETVVHRIIAGAIHIELSEPPPTLHDRLVGADLADPAIAAGCLAVARDRGWAKAIRTRIRKHSGFHVTSRNEIVLQGEPEITVELVPQAFMDALAGDEIDGPLVENLRKILTSPESESEYGAGGTADDASLAAEPSRWAEPMSDPTRRRDPH